MFQKLLNVNRLCHVHITVPIGYSDLGYSRRAGYSDLNPRDGGRSLYPMCTVLNYVLHQAKPCKQPTLVEVQLYHSGVI